MSGFKYIHYRPLIMSQQVKPGNTQGCYLKELPFWCEFPTVIIDNEGYHLVVTLVSYVAAVEGSTNELTPR